MIGSRQMAGRTCVAVTCAAVVACVLTGCTTGGSTDPVAVTSGPPTFDLPSTAAPPQPAPTLVPTTTTSAPAPTTATSTPTETSTTAGPIPEPPTVTGETWRLAGFRSPSGNIGCVVGGGEVRCDVVSSTFAPPPRPADCDGAWGRAVTLEVGGGAGRLLCASDTVVDAGAPVLGYGDAVTAGGIICLSAENGVRCWLRVDPKHGFRLGRASYELY